MGDDGFFGPAISEQVKQTNKIMCRLSLANNTKQIAPRKIFQRIRTNAFIQ